MKINNMKIITSNVLITPDGLFFETNKEKKLREKEEQILLKNQMKHLQKGGVDSDCMVPKIKIDLCAPVRHVLKGILEMPLNMFLKIIPIILNFLIKMINKIIKLITELVDYILNILNEAINQPIKIINYVIQQFRSVLKLLLLVLKGNPLKVIAIIILPYVYFIINFIITNLYIFPVPNFAPFTKSFVSLISGKKYDDVRITGITLEEAINISTVIAILIYIACYYSFFTLIF